MDIRRIDEFFYAQHQVPFTQRWALEKTPDGPSSQNLLQQLNPEHRPFFLVCKNDSSGKAYQFKAPNQDSLLVIEVQPATNNMFDWTDLVLGAQEIHAIDTAFIHFIEARASVLSALFGKEKAFDFKKCFGLLRGSLPGVFRMPNLNTT